MIYFSGHFADSLRVSLWTYWKTSTSKLIKSALTVYAWACMRPTICGQNIGRCEICINLSMACDMHVLKYKENVFNEILCKFQLNFHFIFKTFPPHSTQFKCISSQWIAINYLMLPIYFHVMFYWATILSYVNSSLQIRQTFYYHLVNC